MVKMDAIDSDSTFKQNEDGQPVSENSTSITQELQLMTSLKEDILQRIDNGFKTLNSALDHQSRRIDQLEHSLTLTLLNANYVS